MLQQNERIPRQYRLASFNKSEPVLSLKSEQGPADQAFTFSFEALHDNVFRIAFCSRQHPIPLYPSVRRPSPAFSEQPFLHREDKRMDVKTKGARVTVKWSDTPVVSIHLHEAKKPLYEDLHFRSYAVDGAGVAHYSIYKKGTVHVGLGEKAGPMDLSGRGFDISASDTFGYDAYRTDPLYKHLPLLINITPDGCIAIFNTNHCRARWNVGSEIDGMWGHFKVYRQAHGGLEEYLIVGKTVEEVLKSYAGLVGFPLAVPRYMMGYISGGMKYSMLDSPPASEAILGFLRACKENDIPVSAHQMSSGYTVSETPPKTRNVFTWNRHRFPDPEQFAKEAHRLGVRILANVKPYVLASHAEYGALCKADAFLKDPVTKTTAVARLWSAAGGTSEEGSHIDFTSHAGYQWWLHGCKALRKSGIDAMWNDNNEYNIPGDDWECALQNVPVPPGETRKSLGLWGRAMHTELMAKSSHDACALVQPKERPLVLTRSATAGTMRYASCSWSGDNVTSWEGMRGANALALNAGFSLIPVYGHDIGGFEGPQPTAEHLVRWVQLGIHSPRFAINCYKTDADSLVGDVIEPWMHPVATPMIRKAIKRRYELVPYTYSQCLRATVTAAPVQRWTGWGFEKDKVVWTPDITRSDTQFWFGDALLVAGVYKPGRSTARVYLPLKGDGTDYGFINTNAPFEHREAGKWHEMSAAWYDSIPVLARCGAVVPIGKNVPTTCKDPDQEEDREFAALARDDTRGVEIFPPPKHEQQQDKIEFEGTWWEDDGISPAHAAAAHRCLIVVKYKVGPKDIELFIVAKPSGTTWRPLWLKGGTVDIILPAGEERDVKASSGVWPAAKRTDERGRMVWTVNVDVENHQVGTVVPATHLQGREQY